MVDRDKVISSLNACRNEPGYNCKKDCIFYEIESDKCVVMLLDTLHEYIVDLEGAKEERDRLAAENQELREKLPKWIRAEDEKPPYNTQIKLWTNEGYEYIGVYTYSKQFITDGFFDITHKVTHWMALDDAPEMEYGNPSDTAGASPRPTEIREEEE